MYNGSDYLIKKVIINNKATFDIENEDISYCSFDNYHGLQTVYDGGSEEYKKIMEHCAKIVESIKIIDELIKNKAGKL
jgi:hypothetical protein